ncbi:battenin CLN3 protein [Mortierella sp. AD031]|nr:battenin CLN3 protein [Mortierella sp. AD031]
MGRGIYNHRVGTSARLRQLFSGIERNWIAFFIFGDINNLIYVVILSAAVDLVGSKVPKGVVLLADITPSLLIKTVAPYFVHKVPYTIRVVFCAFLSFSAVVLIAQADSISVRLLGVMMASLSSGLGELTFLMLSSFYRLQMVSAWSSGTGGAGLLGALLFLALTSWIGLSIPRTLAVVSQNLPRPSSRDPKPTLSPLPQSVHSLDQQEQDHSNGNGGSSNTEGEESSVLPSSSSDHASPLLPNNNDHSSTTSSSRGSFAVPMIPSWDITAPSWEAQAPQQLTHTEPTSINTLLAATDPDDPGFVPPFREIEEGGLENTDGGRRRVYKVQPNEAMTMQEKRAMARSLLVPFMFPLFLVYFASEYSLVGRQPR